MIYSKTVFPFMCDKMSRIVMITTRVITPMFATACSSTPSIIDDLEKKRQISSISRLDRSIQIKEKFVRRYLWQDFRYKARQEILLSSSTYHGASTKHIKWYIISVEGPVDSTDPSHHQTKLVRACMLSTISISSGSVFPWETMIIHIFIVYLHICVTYSDK